MPSKECKITWILRWHWQDQVVQFIIHRTDYLVHTGFKITRIPMLVSQQSGSCVSDWDLWNKRDLMHNTNLLSLFIRVAFWRIGNNLRIFLSFWCTSTAVLLYYLSTCHSFRCPFCQRVADNIGILLLLLPLFMLLLPINWVSPTSHKPSVIDVPLLYESQSYNC